MPQTSVEGIPSTRRHGTPGRRPSSTKKASPPGESFHSGIPEIVDLFIADRRAAGRAPATIRYYRETLGRFVRFAGAEPDIGAAAHAWATDRYANARSEASACTYVRAVAILLNFAAARGLYAGDVRLACRSRLGPPRAVPLADLRRALRFLDGDASILVRLLLATGARLGEAVGIRYADIDPRRRAVTVRGGKGGGARVVPLSRRLARLLGPLARAGGADLLFAHPIRYYQRRIEAAALRADVVLSAHRIRHTYAAETIGRGAPLNAIQRVLGHAGPTMTLHYARLYGRDAIEIARRYSPEDRL